MAILARELAIPLSAVTKRGGDSWLVCEQPAEMPTATEMGNEVEYD